MSAILAIATFLARAVLALVLLLIGGCTLAVIAAFIWEAVTKHQVRCLTCAGIHKGSMSENVHWALNHSCAEEQHRLISVSDEDGPDFRDALNQERAA